MRSTPTAALSHAGAPRASVEPPVLERQPARPGVASGCDSAALRAGLAAPPAGEEREGRGHTAPDHEAGHGRPDQGGLAVLPELLAPVGQLGDLRAQIVYRVGELAPGFLDRRADHLGTLRSAHGFTSSPFSSDRATWSRSIFCASRSARARRASSSAISGMGGEPFLNSREAMYAEMPARVKRTSASASPPAKAAPTNASGRSSNGSGSAEAAWSGVSPEEDSLALGSAAC